MKYLLKSFGLITALSLSLVSCKKETPVAPEPLPTTPTTPTAGSLRIEFENIVGANPLALGTTTNYVNAAGNTFNVSMFKYYITNIKLTKADNTIWAEPNSYHLVNASDVNTTSFLLANVPFANYKAIEFMLGVDSASNNSGAQTGDLDPTKDMFWSWNSGYIMMKLEGTSPQSTVAGNKIQFHIGGFSGANKSMRIITPSFNGDTAKVTTSITPKIHVSADVLQVLESPNTIDFSVLSTIHMPGANAVNMANNYADMFAVEHIHN